MFTGSECVTVDLLIGGLYDGYKGECLCKHTHWINWVIGQRACSFLSDCSKELEMRTPQ
jgi:hypothetical protein